MTLPVTHALHRAIAAMRAAVEHGDLERLDAELADVTKALAPASSAASRITKIDEEQRLVYGWALVTDEHDQPLVDLQDDVVSVDDIRETAHEFIKGKRVLGRMHRQMGVGELVESVVLSKDLQQALGIALGIEGWFVGVKVHDDDTWQRVRKGELSMFSIGGTGERTPLTKRRAPVPVIGERVTLFHEALHG